MNTEDFVTYEQAIALKELGFNEKCLHYYEDCEEDPIILDNCYSGDEVLLSDLYYSYNTEDSRRFYDAPTLAQAQKWLRKEKGLVVCPCPEAIFINDIENRKNQMWKHNGWICDILIIKENNELTNGSDVDGENGKLFTSYEEALSAGITECLNFLKKW